MDITEIIEQTNDKGAMESGATLSMICAELVSKTTRENMMFIIGSLALAVPATLEAVAPELMCISWLFRKRTNPIVIPPPIVKDMIRSVKDGALLSQCLSSPGYHICAKLGELKWDEARIEGMV